MLEFITVVRNDLQGLKDTVESIDRLIGEDTDIPLLHSIVDGNSTDGSNDYAFKIVDTRRIKTIVVSEPDLGIYDAMNKGVRNSSSDAVVFLNAGDVLDDSLKLSDLLNDSEEIKATTSPIVFAYCAKIIFRGKTLKIKSRGISVNRPRLPTVHQSMMYRRIDLRAIPYDISFKICGDYDQFSRMYVQGLNVKIRKNVLSKFYSGGVSSQRPVRLLVESLGVSFKYFNLSIFYKVLLVLRLVKSLVLFSVLEYTSKFFSKVKLWSSNN